MPFIRSMSTIEVALAACFAALYAAFGIFKIFPIIGQYGQAITAAAVVAPLIGILFGPVVGVASTFIGGAISLFVYSSSPLSLISGVFAALTSGFVFWKKRVFALGTYLVVWLLLFFYPMIGPAWIFPAYSWFQLIGIGILVSPLHLVSIKSFEGRGNLKLVCTLFLTVLAATLCGQIAGTLAFEIMTPSVGTWVTTFFSYPLERLAIAAAATAIGVPLLLILRTTRLLRFWTCASSREKDS